MLLDHDSIAKAESLAYKAYYAKDKEGFLRHYSHLVKLKYHLSSDEVAKKIAQKYTMAAMAFGAIPASSSPSTYDSKILPLVVDMYDALKSTTNEKWDPQKVAQADLAWWVARRQVDKENPELVAKEMIKQWYEMYGRNDGNHFVRAAYLRSVAGRFGDLCRNKWSGYREHDWDATELLLKQAYYYLSLGIQANNKTG